MSKERTSKSDKFSWDDGDLRMVYNPNDKEKRVFVMDEGWQEELDMVAREGEEDGVTASFELEESTVNFIKELDF